MRIHAHTPYLAGFLLGALSLATGLAAQAPVAAATATQVAATPAAPARHKPVLTLQQAKAVAMAAAQKARADQAHGAVAVVDDGGHLLYLERLDGTFAAASTVATGKAHTAAMFKMPTSTFEKIVNEKGRTTMVALPDFTPLQGGVPLVVEGEVVGAVGVSGANSAQHDEEIAVAAAAALPQPGAGESDACQPAPATEVTFLPRRAVDAAFAAGRPLLEVGTFKVHASRRDAPGQAEVHDDETDIVYVLAGSATLVTGGEVVDGKVTAPGQWRGAAIRGGTEHALVQGDFIVVPKGVPHWFETVQGPFLYYVVKV